VNYKVLDLFKLYNLDVKLTFIRPCMKKVTNFLFKIAVTASSSHEVAMIGGLSLSWHEPVMIALSITADLSYKQTVIVDLSLCQLFYYCRLKSRTGCDTLCSDVPAVIVSFVVVIE
jgi:hypothetical protein